MCVEHSLLSESYFVFIVSRACDNVEPSKFLPIYRLVWNRVTSTLYICRVKTRQEDSRNVTCSVAMIKPETSRFSLYVSLPNSRYTSLFTDPLCCLQVVEIASLEDCLEYERVKTQGVGLGERCTIQDCHALVKTWLSLTSGSHK